MPPTSGNELNLDRLQLWYRIGVGLIFCAFVVFVFASSHDDWDGALTGFEIDLRSWLIDGKPPLWSYQLCSGVTRLGDPQALGLSPMFLPILIFGSFWGAKVLTVGLAILGYFSLYRLLLLIVPGAPTPDLRLALNAIAFFVISGNYFLWHISVGHVSFGFFSVGFWIVYCILRTIFGSWNWRYASLLFFAVFCFFTGGFYHSLVFCLIPSALIFLPCSAMYFLRTRIRWPRGSSLRLAGLIAVCGAAIGAASYKILPVLRYQGELPRVFSDHGKDGSSILHFLAYFFVPTIGATLPGANVYLDAFDTYEYSFFSYISVLLLCAAWWLFSRNPDRKADSSKTQRPNWLPELALAGLLAVLFALGDTSPIPIHSWLNALLFQNSTRSVGRYNILALLVSAIFIANLLANERAFRTLFLRYLLLPGLLFVPLNMLTFLPRMDIKRSLLQENAPVDGRDKMNELVVVTPRLLFPRLDSFMYPATRMGGIVLNCYDPLMRYTRVAGEDGVSNKSIPLDQRLIPLLNPGKKPVSEACRESAYVTQNNIFFDRAACPDDLCFNINMLDPWRPSGLVLNQERGLYCVK